MWPNNFGPMDGKFGTGVNGKKQLATGQRPECKKARYKTYNGLFFLCGESWLLNLGSNQGPTD